MSRTVVGKRETGISQLRGPRRAYKGPAAILTMALIACVVWCAAAAGGSTEGAAGVSVGGESRGRRLDASPVASAAITVMNTNDAGPGSLRAAIAAAVPGETINFAPGVSGVITLTTGELLVNKDLTIAGPGARLLAINGNDMSRVLRVTGVVKIDGLTIFGGRVTHGGGIFNSGILNINRCVISFNRADFEGGGILNTGMLTVANSTVSGNSAGFIGGSLGGGGILTTGGTLTVINCTISANSGNSGIRATDNTTIISSTIAAHGGVGIHGGPSTTFRSSIIAGNGLDIQGRLNSQGFNLIGRQVPGAADITPSTGDQIGTQSQPIDARLGPLQNNGGPTDTHALLAASPAFDAGDDLLTGSPLQLTTDQRGQPRPFNGRVDTGAVEAQPTRTVTNTLDSGAGSLRDAIANAAPNELINFNIPADGPNCAPSTGVCTITLTTGELLVNKDLTIVGPGARRLSVSGNNASRVFLTTGGMVYISGLTITNGRTTAGGGGIHSVGGLTLDSCAVSNNATDGTNGGGIFQGGATLNVRNSTISGNRAPTAFGGGMYIAGGVANITNSTISGNATLSGFGGGITNVGGTVLTVTASTVANNNSVFGGGIHAGGSTTVNIRSSIVAGNTAGIGPDIEGTANSQGFNLIGNNQDADIIPAAGDQIGTPSQPVNARLGPLQNNGGPTNTHDLLAGSPALDAGDDTLTGPPHSLLTDQRGFERRFGAKVDVGAFEFQNNFTVTNTNDNGPGSLRQAIINANGKPNGVARDTVSFNIPPSDPNCAPVGGVCTIRPTSALPDITDAVVISGYTQPGAKPNTLAVGNDAVLLVELDGSLAGVGPNGLRLTGGESTVLGLVINRFRGANFTQGNGIVLQSHANTVAGCFIGTDAGGTQDLGNTGSGIFVTGSSNNIGGGAPSARNVLSNNEKGVDLLNSDTNFVRGNYIGTSRDGQSPLGNRDHGVLLNSSRGNTVGGGNVAMRNVISANGGEGIYSRGVASNANHIIGNFIGTNASGSDALGNGRGGVLIDSPNCTVGGAGPGVGNLISGNEGNGITLDTAAARGAVVHGNTIGAGFDGPASLGNVGAGVAVLNSASNNAIGGTFGDESNLISFNVSHGITVQSGTGNRLLGNRILSNNGLGIDLSPAGVTTNDPGDADAGANNLQNFPAINSVVTDSTSTNIGGTLNSTPNTSYRVEFFSNATCDTTGNGEGRVFLGFTNVVTDGGGNASFNFTRAAIPLADRVTATATDPAGNTSEFSACAGALVTTLTVTNTNDNGPGSLRQAVTDANSLAGTQTINFNLPGTGVRAIILSSELPAITSPVVIDGYTQPGATPNTLPSGNDARLLVELRGVAVDNCFRLEAGDSVIRGLSIRGFRENKILLLGAGAKNNRITGNFIGIDPASTFGSFFLPTGAQNGVQLASGASGNFIGTDGDGVSDLAERNIISGNFGDGVRFNDASNNRVSGNLIGHGASGASVFGNDTFGVSIVSGSGNIVGTDGDGVSDTLERNVISGNGVNRGGDILIHGSASTANRVAGNFIGTDAAGDARLSSGTHPGVTLRGARGNFVGTNGDGNGDAAEGNVIAAAAPGVHILESGATANRVAGNFIGTNPAGANGLGNNEGVRVEAPAADNHIGANGDGVSDALERNVISGNFGRAGVVIGGTNNAVVQNEVTANLGAGVLVSGGAGQSVRRNSISSNAGLGLDLGANGVNTNDAFDFDSGANNLQNFPVITSVALDGEAATARGNLNSTPGRTFVVEFFANADCDTSGNGEGLKPVGESLVTTGADGNAAFTSLLPTGVGVGQLVTATATDVSLFDHDGITGTPPVPRNDTSEFSPCAVAVNPSQDITLTVTNTNDGGAGSLREAVGRVNSSGGGVINFAPGLGGTITLIGGEIEIRAARSVTILGPGSNRLTVSGNKSSRVFGVHEGEVKISGLTIANGLVADAGGGVLNFARLLLADCQVSANESANVGGGIFNGGTLTVNNSEVSNNKADRGGGVFNNSRLNVTGSTLFLNRAENGGGGILNATSFPTVVEFSTVSTNSGFGEGGGGILNLEAGPTNLLTVRGTSVVDNVGIVGGGIHNKGRAEVFNSNVSTNAASNGGGGILNSAGATLNLTNSTVSGNNTISAGNGTGGAGVSNLGTLNLTSCTVTRNNGPGLGAGVFNAGTANVRSSIVAGNTTSPHLDVSGQFNSLGFNLIGVKEGGGGFEHGAGGDQVGTASAPLDPMLGPLRPNGGPTDTHALLAGSPAFDKGDDRITGPPFNLTTDQRGRPRPGRARVEGGNVVRDPVDIGAFETGFIISGDVFNPTIMKGLARVIISLADRDSVLRTTETDAGGSFVFTDVPEGDGYVLRQQFLGGSFDPEKRQFSGITLEPVTLAVPPVGGSAGDVTGLQFRWRFSEQPFIANVTVLVRVRGSNPPAFVRGATITLSGPKSEVTNVTQPNSDAYLFEQVPRGGDYVITPTHPDFTFEAVQCVAPGNAGANARGGCELKDLQGAETVIFEGVAVKPPPPALDDNFDSADIVREHFNFGILSLDPCDSAPGAVSVKQGAGLLTITPLANRQAEPCEVPAATAKSPAGAAAAVADSDGAFNGYVAVRDVDLNSVTSVSVKAVKTLEGPGAHTIFSVGRDNTDYFRIRVGQETLESGPARAAASSSRARRAPESASVPLIFFETNGSKFSQNFNEQEDVFWRLRFEPVRAFSELPEVCRSLPRDSRRVVLFETSENRVLWTARHCAPIDRTRTQVASELLAGIVGDTNRSPGNAAFSAYRVAEQTRIGFRPEGLSPVIDPKLTEQDVQVEVERKGDTDSSALVSYEFDATSDLQQGVHFDDITEGAGRLAFEPGEAKATRPITLRLRVGQLGANIQRLKLRLKDDPQDAEDDVAGGVIDETSDEATVEVGSGNPIERARFFVTQNYLDFLGRGPDNNGLDFWAKAIEACGGDQHCVNAARVNVSAAFFLSIEFQETGLGAYLANKAAYGNIPGKPVPVRLCQLESESKEMKGDVQVGVGEWDKQLEANKAAYYRRFVETDRFKEKYDRLGSTEYVSALFANAGVSPTAEERTTLALGLLTKTETRATVLRKVSERADLKRAETNRAFVLMQYFGYLRRNPDEGRDTDFGGFDFWLKKLDEHGGDYNAAQMVFAFLDCDEYKSRFVNRRSDPCGGP